jgi:hypothetical protein
MVKCGVLFEVRTEFLNNIWTSFGFKGLNIIYICPASYTYQYRWFSATDKRTFPPLGTCKAVYAIA